MKRLILINISILFLMTSHFVLPQEIVISEYDPVNEWIELLVIQDNINLEGYILRDNTAESDSWQKGIIFNDNPLWQGLREGTIIVVWTRKKPGFTQDVQKTDGYIELPVQLSDNNINDEFFDLETGFNISPTGSLALDEGSDIVQILNPVGNNVHTLAHISENSALTKDFASINGNKLARDSVRNIPKDIQSISIKVFPGANLPDYSMGGNGFDENNDKTDVNIDNATLGLPNHANDPQFGSQEYWRELRQPDYEPVRNLQVDYGDQGVELSWEPSAPQEFHDNLYEGYIIIKAQDGVFGGFEPEDGRIYNTNVDLNTGNAEFVTNVPGLYQDFYIDNYINLTCGVTYEYRIYMYRYNISDFDSQIDANTWHARGRSYKENVYAEIGSVRIDGPPKPVLSLIEPETATFCAGETIVIESDIDENAPIPTFRWLLGNGRIDDLDIEEESISRIVINNFSGKNTIRLQLEYPNGCQSDSELLEINAIETPVAGIKDFYGNTPYSEDTTIVVCDEITLETVILNNSEVNTDNVTYQWYKDGVLLEEKVIPNINITEDGEYHAIVFNENQCPDTTFKINVDIKEINFIVNPQTLTYYVPPSPITFDKIEIINLSDRDIVFDRDDIKFTGPFELDASSSLPVTIAENDTDSLTILTTATAPGTYTGTMILNNECDKADTVEIEVIIEDTDNTFLEVDKDSIDFGYVLKCDGTIDTTLTLTLNGNKDVNVLLPESHFPNSRFSVEYANGFPKPMSGNGTTFTFKVNHSTVAEGEFIDTLTINYEVDGELSENPLKVFLKIYVVDPRLELIDDNFDFSVIYCEDHIDTVMKVFNPGVHFDVTIEQNIGGDNDALFGRFELLNPPISIPPGETVKVPVRIYIGSNFPQLVYGPCQTLTKPIVTNGTNDGEVPELSDKNVDFGTINTCEINSNQSITVSIQSEVDGMMISGIDGFDTGNFESDLQIGRQLIKGDNEFTITLPIPNANNLDNVSDRVYIYLEPCNERLEINMSANFYTPIEPTVSESTLDFGNYTVGNPFVTRTFEITNNDIEPLTLNSIDGVDPPFVLISPNENDFPITLQPNSDPLLVEYSFQPNDGNSYSDIGNIIFDSPCDFDTSITLSGISSEIPPERYISAFLPNDLVAEPGFNIEIPVNWRPENQLEIDQSEINRVEIYISYDESVLYPFNGYVSADVVDITDNVVFEEYDRGKTSLTYDVVESQDFDPEYMGIFEARALLGNKLNTVINIDSLALISPSTEIRVETEQGALTVNGKCEIESRLLEVNGNVGININPIMREDIELDFSVVTEDNTNIRIYDNLGNPVDELINGSLLPGAYTLYYNSSNMSSGSYYVVMKTGNFVKTERFILIK